MGVMLVGCLGYFWVNRKKIYLFIFYLYKLFIGMSFLSLVEIFDLLSQMVLSIFKKEKVQNYDQDCNQRDKASV